MNLSSTIATEKKSINNIILFTLHAARWQPFVGFPGRDFSMNEALPSILHASGSRVSDLFDGNNDTCLRIPAVERPPQQISIRLEEVAMQGATTELLVHGRGLSCEWERVQPLVQPFQPNTCSGLFHMCRVEPAPGNCKISCKNPAAARITIQLNLWSFEHDAVVCKIEG
jgi:hypothetical protein